MRAARQSRDQEKDTRTHRTARSFIATARAQPQSSWDGRAKREEFTANSSHDTGTGLARTGSLHAACGFGEGNGGGGPCADGDEDVGQRKRVVANLTTGAARNRQGVAWRQRLSTAAGTALNKHPVLGMRLMTALQVLQQGI